MYKQYPNMLRILTILPLRILSFFFTVEDPHPEEFLLPYPPRDGGPWGGTKMVRTRDFNLWKVRMLKTKSVATYTYTYIHIYDIYIYIDNIPSGLLKHGNGKSPDKMKM